MDVWQYAFVIFCSIIVLVFFVLGLMSFLRKGPLLNSTYPNDGDIDKKLYYYQSGMIFIIVSLYFLGLGILFYFDKFKIIFPYTVIFCGIFLAFIISSIVYISYKNKER